MSPVIGDSFDPDSTDREPGQTLDRAWTSEGVGRWRADNLGFAAGAKVSIAADGATETVAGEATFPFVPDNYAGSPDLFFEGTIVLGNGLRVGLGLSNDTRPGLVEKGGQIWFDLALDKTGANGAWTLWGSSGGDPLGLSAGILPGFDPAQPIAVRVETVAGGFVLTLDGQVVASGTPFLPLDGDIRGAGIRIDHGGTPTAPTGAVELFRAGLASAAGGGK